jgi:diguanylate cyclase (GGDEF)-like protein
MVSQSNKPNTLLSRLGLIGSVIFIAVIAAVVSIPITWLLVEIFGMDYTLSTLFLSVVVPMLVAPAIAVYFLKMYFKLQRLENQMHYIATYDSLTGLLTRQSFFERSSARLEQAYRTGRTVTVLYLDLDNFKMINDTYGHGAGDKVLSFFGYLLRETFREDDILGRIGGEEACVVLDGLSLEDTLSIIERIFQSCRTHRVRVEGKSIGFSVSIGAAITRDEPIDLDTLIAQADKALYHAKNTGKDRAYLFTQEGFELLSRSDDVFDTSKSERKVS